MIPLIIWGCIIMAYFFMMITIIIKGIAAWLNTMMDMVEVWAILLLAGAGIGVVELIVLACGASFWAIVGIILIFFLLGWLFGIMASIFIIALEVAMYVVSFIYIVLDTILEKLGEWSEKGLQFFLGIINTKVALS